MAKYKSKVVEIDAIEFTHENFDDIVEFTGGLATNLHTNDDGKVQCNIHTLEGVMTATETNFIIRGLKGEYYPCIADVFHEKYEPV